MLRIYADRSGYRPEQRKSLNDILKALWIDTVTDEHRAKYGSRLEHFRQVERPEDADLHLLPFKWLHYVELGTEARAVEAVAVARRAKRPIAVFTGGDAEANFPVAGADIHMFQPSAYRSRRQITQHGLPAFIDDPLLGPLDIRDKKAKASIGFCGQAGSSLPRHAARLVRNRYKRLRWRVGRERFEPPPLEHTWFRKRVLDTFARSTEVETRYVLRTKYRAGVTGDGRNDPKQQARREFLDNLTGTDYTLAMRGGGNFSVRFYEALAVGRTPIFIDTDCVLPFHNTVDWRRHVVWVDERDLAQGPQRVAAHFASLDQDAFAEQQRQARALWLERLTPDGFYRHFHEHFAEFRGR